MGEVTLDLDPLPPLAGRRQVMDIDGCRRPELGGEREPCPLPLDAYDLARGQPAREAGRIQAESTRAVP